MEFSPEKAFEEKRLIQHTIRIVEVVDPRFCENLCYMEPDCVSINLDKREDRHGNYKCELNNVTHEGYEHQLEDHEVFFYHAAEVNIFFSIHTFLRKYLFLPWHFCFNGLLKLELRQWLSHLKECFVLVSAMTMIITMTLKITKTTTILMSRTHHNYDVHIDDAELTMQKTKTKPKMMTMTMTKIMTKIMTMLMMMLSMSEQLCQKPLQE